MLPQIIVEHEYCPLRKGRQVQIWHKLSNQTPSAERLLNFIDRTLLWAEFLHAFLLTANKYYYSIHLCLLFAPIRLAGAVP